ncbi:MAG: hypothetical protein JSU08_17280 [Acidobacteria bacterium]|nr:hypothetical protein [Acidobacteriota bacterium]
MSIDEHYEQLLAYIGTHMPTPFAQEEVDGVIIFTGGSPGEVIVRLTDTSVIVEEYAVRWESPFTPVVRPRRVGLVKWRRLPESELMTVVGELIKGAREMRRSRYRICHFCHNTFAPEWMSDDVTCRQCVEREAGVVH